ncbi:beta galactosidase small chain domain protein [Prevotella sp. MSX73]|nr:beta galactosidase small chain domain protein [Prevotella sp. MSX73]
MEAVDAPFSFSALHYSASDLYHADHDFKLPKTDYTILSIAARSWDWATAAVAPVC